MGGGAVYYDAYSSQILLSRLAVLCSQHLVAGAGKNLVDGFPEPEGTVADRDLGSNGEATALNVDQKLAPALGAFPHANLKPTSSCLPSGVAPITPTARGTPE